ncbi:hypothetical protein SDJN02_09950, partial [Cucurbita argyrosperma subsp. argyrosperma]
MKIGDPFKSSNEVSQSKSIKKSSHLSLSEFLDRKLPESFVLQRTVKGKSTPFSSLQGPRDANSSMNKPIGIHYETDSQTESAISKVLFEEFKRSEPNQSQSSVLSGASEADIFSTDDMLESRKRKILSEGFASTTPYASGGGWWDCDMEGVDSEEVGLGEVWEGVGSTTLGGIEWH